jgi:tetratricopeptide (TPR) repeat protein
MKSDSTRYLFPFLFICFLFVRASGTHQERDCSGTSDCNFRGTTELRKGNPKSAIAFFKYGAAHAEDRRDVPDMAATYNELANAYIEMQDYWRAQAWLRLALKADPTNARAKAVLNKIRYKLRNLTEQNNPVGTYTKYAGRGEWNAFCVSQSTPTDVHFRFIGLRMGNNWKEFGPASYGDISGKMALLNPKQFEYHNTDDFPTCRIEAHFGSKTAELTQSGDCGFGYGVEANGIYEKVSASVQSDEQCSKSTP